jgi:hypothetical protein
MATNEAPSTQRSVVGATSVCSHWPSAAASVWLSSVATRMPAMMGTGRL